jgi:pyruvate dehydrogenase E1 component subunit beta
MSATTDRAGTAVMTYREALRLALREELSRDDRVFLMGEEVGLFDGSYKVTAGLLDEFGADRVRDTPISEEGFVGAGVGAAMLGERPVVEIMTINFLLVALDQVVSHAANVGAMFGGELRCPLIIRTRNQLTAQHSQSVDGWFAGTPGLKVVAPVSPADAKGLLKAAIRDDDPVLVIENLRMYAEKGAVPLDPELHHADRPGPRRAAGQRHHHRRPRVRDRPRTRRRGATGDRRRGSRGGRPALAAAAGCRTVVASVAKTNRALCVRRAGRATGSAPNWPPASRRRASTTSTRRSSASAWPGWRFPPPRTSSGRRSRRSSGSRRRRGICSGSGAAHGAEVAPTR